MAQGLPRWGEEKPPDGGKRMMNLDMTIVLISLLALAHIALGVALAWLRDADFPMGGCICVMVWFGLITLQVYAPLIVFWPILPVSFLVARALTFYR